jgi:hypothetical protein
MQHVASQRKEARFARVKARYDEQLAEGHLTAAEVLLRQLLSAVPDWAAGWFDLGLIAKLRRDWPASLEANERALDVGDGKPGDPAAWNLGIAATALGDWDTARQAWAAYGIELPPDGESLGQVPIRLNPPPRHPGQRPLLVDGTEHGAEVVWADRLSPAHAVVTVVPLSGSGHRYGDVVLVDGEPTGTRELPDGRIVPVFDELERLVPSDRPTTAAAVTAPAEADADALSSAVTDAGLHSDDWTTSVRAVCDNCDDTHDHTPPDVGWRRERVVGIAGDRKRAATVLDRWAAEGPGRAWRSLT